MHGGHRYAELAFVEYTYEERMDTDRVSNPHGEHAHGFFVVGPLA